MNIFLSIYIVILKILYIIFFEKLKKFKNAEIIRLDDNTVKVIIEKKFKSFGRNSFEGFSNVGPSQVDYKPIELDNCPIFTELDEKKDKFDIDIKERKKSSFENPTLPLIVDFIVRYARDSRLHLYYTHEEIATFIAGLGTTNLSILQGMSGTGKTSLPKIVAEALNSNCDIVEVESSWRDKNELLGYYNEISKIYTPKKFTQALYKSKLNSEDYGKDGNLYISIYDIDSFRRIQQILLKGMIYSDEKFENCPFCGNKLNHNNESYVCNVCRGHIIKKRCPETNEYYYYTVINNDLLSKKNKELVKKYSHLNDRFNEARYHYRNITQITNDGKYICPKCKKIHD